MTPLVNITEEVIYLTEYGYNLFEGLEQLLEGKGLYAEAEQLRAILKEAERSVEQERKEYLSLMEAFTKYIEEKTK